MGYQMFFLFSSLSWDTAPVFHFHFLSVCGHYCEKLSWKPLLKVSCCRDSRECWGKSKLTVVTMKNIHIHSINHLLLVGNVPLSCISREGSEKSTSKISSAAVVLKEASSCCADVPKARYIGWWPAGLHAWWAVRWISFSLIFLDRWRDFTKSKRVHSLMTIVLNWKWKKYTYIS